MSAIPLHLQRKLEQRWAAKFASPVASAAPKNTDLKGAVTTCHAAERQKKDPLS
jgi:hypothetical protein